ncbi:hypothetical protein GYMLUDRAFT_42802 [Collybiopsis luxurians FD-317 M1]|uniref:deoxyribose-phosphate aldolase n=1 Tax=Collybiopsis luxurians FD-317 M1 TaxID=944289 RepID=A0A0D0BDF8_9AGAR|nr:hypothetical protein GYMLUDRAFT_42802 [Collybiopsis luxurians FD-317 M1]
MDRADEHWKALIDEKIGQVFSDIEAPPPISITQPADNLFPSTIDHTLLKPDATAEQIDQLCSEALEYQFKSCCVNGANIEQVAKRLRGSSTTIPCAVIGFPMGACTTAVKAFEAQDAIRNGAREIDMVINIGALKSQYYNVVFSDIYTVVQAVSSSTIPVKVILETALLTDGEKVAGAFIAAEAGAAFVKTCTGFNGGGATKEDVIKLFKTVRYKGGKVKVKASAGIRSFEKCLEMLRAGADRIGTWVYAWDF